MALNPRVSQQRYSSC